MATLKNTTVNDTGYLQLPVGTTAQRPNTPTIGYTRVNTTTNSVEIYNGSSWITWLSLAGIEATGGTVQIFGGYKYHVFTSSGTFQVTQAGSSAKIDYLVVGAGGGGGGWHAGGGGGGAIVHKTNYSITTGNFPIVIGAGGTSSAAPSHGQNGSNTTAFGETMTGGGGGGAYGAGEAGNAGANGGGSGGNGTTAGGTGTAPPSVNGGVVYAGYNGGTSAFQVGGGGGGGGGVGSNGVQGQKSGAGGPGKQIDFGLYYYYWSGGGGAGNWQSSGGDGGIGGGGGGCAGNGPSGGSGGGTAYNNGGTGGNGNNQPGGAGGANTGGGGGGAEAYSGTGGLGGSGMVIIRYAI